MDFRHLIVTCLFSMLRLSFETQKIKENYAILNIKRPFSPEKMQKQGIKTHPTQQINIPTPPQRPRADPGLHLSHTRASVVGTPGSQAALQAVFDKRKACLDEKRSRFNRFCTCSRTVPVFIV